MLVKDRMTHNPITITPDTSFPTAFRIMRENKIRHLPVVDENKQLVGIVTQTDMLHASPSVTTLSIFEMNYVLANLHVRDVMTSAVVTVSEDAPLEETARLMVQKKISSLPVMREGELVGLITETDIFQMFVEVLGGEEACLRITVQVREAKGELARVSSVIAGLGGNICSVARFHGEDPEHAFITFRLEDVIEETFVPALKAAGEQVVHVCCAG